MAKRLHFYEKLGFKLNDYEYYQLPLREGSNPIEMIIMSYPQKLDETQFEVIKNDIYKNVYNAKKNKV